MTSQYAHGRAYTRGERHHKAKLEDADVVMILCLNDAGVGYKRLARKFDSHPSTIRNYCVGRTRGVPKV